MSKRLRKLLLLTVKIAIAIALLGWVFSSVHWHDYVEAKADGKSYAVLEAYPSADAPRELLISDGKFWGGSQWREPVENFEPLSESGEVVRKGFASSISGLKVWLLVCAAGGFLVSMLIVTVRWWFMLRIQRIRIGLWESARLTFLGLFFNAVVPGTVGGDLVKAYYVSKHTPRKAAALVSTFVDRMMGLT
ncbi:MAG: flippase-like domain-containing protein, partial [Phycisphaerae bacterium]|nr:flippase-like domain-containing protein [Phycisphaerae bacterium]